MSPFTRAYYAAKPFLPRWLRMRLRRLHARRARNHSRHYWPIQAGSERPPAGWPGWPDGKKFAVVLTHDVEGPKGYGRIQELARVEQELGFRSSFNLIPEGPYRVEPELRQWLTDQGFEVGLHDLHHDGKLYRSRAEFSRHARKINRYVQEWGVAGFRSAYMHHNLEWLGDLDVAYDASTFDTDPFEPQPDGVGTIFPFWVPKQSSSSSSSSSSSNGSSPLSAPPLRAGERAGVRCSQSDLHPPHSALESASSPLSALNSPLSNDASQLSTTNSQLETGASAGFVELPYTLVQDSTLFLFLGETTIDCWKRKLDWIAEHGGMVLLNVHPDYMSFQDRPTEDEYPARLYREFLAYLRDRYAGEYWHALPREAAAHVQAARPVLVGDKPAPARRICMLAHTFYESDGRVIRYAESLARRGDQVEVLALHPVGEPLPPPTRNGVAVSHILGRAGAEGSQLAHLWQLVKFLVKANLHLLGRQLRQPYDLIHVHNIPDFLVFATWLHKLCGGRVILDIHDVVPELFANKFGVAQEGFLMESLKLTEKLSCAFSDHVIIANHLWYDKVTTRSVLPERCTPFINNVDTALFRPRPARPANQRQIMIFPGSLQWHQGLDVAIDALALLREELPRLDLHVYGGGQALPDLVRQAARLGLQDRVRFFPGRPLAEIIPLVAAADIGVVPKRSDSFGNEAYSTKIMEFMSLGIPAVVSRTRIDDFYFNDDVVAFFEPQNPADLARAVKRVLGDGEYRARLVANGLQYARENSWETVQQQYLDLVDRLLAA
jgi:glycosyltransferase involved in cell wall biosynthesis